MLGLRSLKKRLIDDINVSNQRLSQIDTDLSLDEPQETFAMDNREDPSIQYQVENNEVVAYQEERQRAMEAKLREEMESNEGDQKDEDEQDEDDREGNQQQEVKVEEKKEVVVQEKEKPVLSDVESSIDEVIRMRLQIEKDTILKGRKNKLEDFDNKIRELNVQKAKLDVELKYSENKL